MISDKVLKQWIKNAIYLYNNGSDNQEYLRGQVELAIYLLGGSSDDKKLITELYNSAKNTK
jgi:hypothetical protein